MIEIAIGVLGGDLYFYIIILFVVVGLLGNANKGLPPIKLKWEG